MNVMYLRISRDWFRKDQSGLDKFFDFDVLWYIRRKTHVNEIADTQLAIDYFIILRTVGI